MGMSNNGWVRRRTALLLSATLAVSPVLAVPAFATQDGDAPSPIEQNDDQTTDQGGEKDPEVEKTPNAETVDPKAEKDQDAEQGTGEKDGAAEKDGVPADTTDQPAAEPRSGGVAQVGGPDVHRAHRRRQGGQRERRHAHAAEEHVREHHHLAPESDRYGRPERRVLGLADSCG